MLGDSIVKNLNDYFFLTKRKKNLKARSFSGTRVSCMCDHVKPTMREFWTNEPNSSKKTGQISRSVIVFAHSLSHTRTL